MLEPVLSFLSKAIAPLVDGIKWVSTVFMAKAYGQKKEQNKNLEQTNDTQKKQIEIAARPPSLWSDILKRMRRNKR